jgi:hypothetical protein
MFAMVPAKQGVCSASSDLLLLSAEVLLCSAHLGCRCLFRSRLHMYAKRASSVGNLLFFY